MAGTKNSGWVPQQHGAWAMIVVPYLTGLALAAPHRPLGLGDLFLGLTWLVGYFAFNAATLTLKSPAKRRTRYYVPLATYTGAASASGLVTLVFKGWPLLWWVPPYAVVLGVSLWLAASKRERSLLSGVLTIVASCGLMGVLRLWPGAPALEWREWAVMAVVTLYFIGTVLHVKALIRERNDPRSAPRCIAYHAVLAVLIVGAVAAGWLTWWWIPWALLLVVRAWWMPRARRKPGVIGAVEIVNSVLLLALVLFA